jgi:hypothetical protein
MHRIRRRRWPIARSIFTIALMALLLIEGVAITVHSSTVRHTVCPDHGESLDVAPRTAIEHAHATGDSASRGPLVRAGDSHGSDHDACAFELLDRARRQEVHGDLPFLGRAPEGKVAVCVDQIVGRLTVARIRFAPKHSPPA